ncbi:MAG: glutaredoxin domain-containing protein [Candidatus Hermodarchaeota archaeon]|nr:glutaredoxin domain-containing protein [Candidatus Hermodarchaeota archaeon]
MFSSSVCPRCDVLKRYLTTHGINHSVRMIDEPEARVDALMLNIYSTPALVIGDKVLHQEDMFANNQLDISMLLSFLRSNGHGTA